MNKVITINLNGNAFSLEESGYEALREYLDHAALRLEGNPDKEEITADIEQAIADKFRAILGPYKTVVATREVKNVILEMGPVQDASAPTDGSASDPAGTRPSAAPGEAENPKEPAGEGSAASGPRRLYIINEGAMLAGVCNGLAAYLNIDVTIVRVVFVLSVISFGAGVLLYGLLAFLLPTAETSAQKAAAYGTPFTAEEFIRRAKAGYYEGMKTLHDKRAHREWKRRFKREMRGWKKDFQWQMHTQASQWKQNWRQWWAPPRPHPIGALILLPFLSPLRWLLGLLAFGVFISFLATGAVFGLPLPFGLHGWIGLVFLLVLYSFLAWPLKALQHACLYCGTSGSSYAAPVYVLWNLILWLGLLLVLIWQANRYLPQAHEALQNLPPMVHQAVDSAQRWWSSSLSDLGSIGH